MGDNDGLGVNIRLFIHFSIILDTMADLSPAPSASVHTLTHESCHHTIFRPFPTPQGWRQWFYLCGIQGFFAGLIDGGANFGIAYAMYHGQKDVRMWVMSKNTVGG